MRVSRDFVLPRAGSTSSVALGLLVSTLGCGPDPVPAGTGGGGPSTAVSSTAGTTSSSATTNGSSTTITTTTSGSGTGGDASSGGGGATSAGGGGAGTGTGGSGPGAGGGGSGPGTGTGGSGGAATTTGSGGAGGAEVPCAGDPDDTPCAGGICCGGACIAANDDTNCHACGNACGALETCGPSDCELDCTSIGQVECNGECIDLAEDDPANCGACGRDCGGTDCLLGACEAFLIHQDEVALGGIARGNDAIYMSFYHSGATSGPAVRRYQPSTGQITTILSTSRIYDGVALTDSGELALAGANHQWCNPDDCQATLQTGHPVPPQYWGSPRLEAGGGYVFGMLYNIDYSFIGMTQCSTSGCAGIVSPLPLTGFGTAVSADRIFWTNGNGVFTRSIAPPDAQPPTVAYRSNLAEPFRLAVGGGRLYAWERGSGQITSGAAAAAPGSITTEATSVTELVDMAFQGGNLYWLRGGSSLRVEGCEVSDCPGTRRTLGTLPPLPYYFALVVEGGHLYVASEQEGSSSLGRLFQVPR